MAVKSVPNDFQDRLLMQHKGEGADPARAFHAAAATAVLRGISDLAQGELRVGF